MNSGLEAEVLFDYLAIEKNIMVSRPAGDADYDRICDCNGKLTKVQIKSTTFREKGCYIIKTSKRFKGARVIYGSDVDIIAVYVKPESCWLLVPSAIIKSTVLKFSVKGKYRKYINNWSCLV